MTDPAPYPYRAFEPGELPGGKVCEGCQKERPLYYNYDEVVLCRMCISSEEQRKQRVRERGKRRWAQLVKGNERLRDYTLCTFPAEDAAGKSAKERARFWLAKSYAAITHPNGELAVYRDEDEWYDLWEQICGVGSPLIDDADYRTGAFIYGGIGSGKSGLAWAMLTTVHHDDNSGEVDLRWANVVWLIAEAKRAMNHDEVDDPFEALMRADVIVLDDLGATRVTEWSRNAILELVQHRYDSGHPTIVTSNYAPSELAKRLGQPTKESPVAEPLIGQRIVSRLTEDAVKIKLDRPDLRARRAAA